MALKMEIAFYFSNSLCVESYWTQEGDRWDRWLHVQVPSLLSHVGEGPSEGIGESRNRCKLPKMTLS